MGSGCSTEGNLLRALAERARGQSILAGTRVPVLKKLPPVNSEEPQGRWVTGEPDITLPARHSSESAVLLLGDYDMSVFQL